MLLDKLVYLRDCHGHDEIHEQLSQAIAEVRRVRRILCDTVSPH